MSGSARGDHNVDVAIIGAGFSGLYALHRLRQDGLRVRVFDEAGGVGGTWWWTRYPGARVDIPGGPFYCYTFSEELAREWSWTETQPDQRAVLGYLEHVADKFDLHRDIQLRTRVLEGAFEESTRRWTLHLSTGERVTARFVVSAVGTLTAQAPNLPEIPGLDEFAGHLIHTAHWPQHEPVMFGDKRVGVIGTGSSAVQLIPQIAREAARLFVFQRTPQYTFPARNRPIPPDVLTDVKARWPELRKRLYETNRAYPLTPRKAADDTPEQRREMFEQAWEQGGMAFLELYSDIVTDREANASAAEFVRSKIRQIVRDPDVADALMPSYFFATKRPIMDEGYYETFNRSNVSLVDLRQTPITRVTPQGIETAESEYPLDILILATGYDAISGGLIRLNLRGRDGQPLASKWHDRVRTYLGLGVSGFPNLFMVHGPESPSVISNMPIGAERQGDWVGDCIRYMRERGLDTIEPLPDVEAAWGREVENVANRTLLPLTDSWYTGANVAGKPRQVLLHLDRADYFERLAQVANNGYSGFILA